MNEYRLKKVSNGYKLIFTTTKGDVEIALIHDIVKFNSFIDKQLDRRIDDFFNTHGLKN